MDYKVKVRYTRIGRRKISRLIPFVKGIYVTRAIANLFTMPQMASQVLRKAIKSGIANALFKSRNINPDTLWVKNVLVDRGPMLKRIRPASRGSADPILKPFSHLTVVLSDEAIPEKKKRVKSGGHKSMDTMNMIKKEDSNIETVKQLEVEG